MRLIDNLRDISDECLLLATLGLNQEEIEGYFDLFEENYDNKPSSLAYCIIKRKEALDDI
jgi:hypothetical protein